MKISIKNIGKIASADVEIKGITVIAGENNTGKSTVSRALYSVFNGFYKIQDQVKAERIASISSLIEKLILSSAIEPYFPFDCDDVAKEVISRKNEFIQAEGEKAAHTLIEIIQQASGSNLRIPDTEAVMTCIGKVNELLQITDEKILESAVGKKLAAEYNNQVCNIFSEEDGEIELLIGDKTVQTHVYPDGSVSIENRQGLSLQTEAVYIDDPYVLDEFSMPYRRLFRSQTDHRSNLKAKLFSSGKKVNVLDEIVAKDKLNCIYEKISSVYNGDIIRGIRSGISLKRTGSNKTLNVQNISMGLKTFIILKMLLMNGTIEQNGTVILDEPEIHLHPEWQLLFAELIVLIQKEFGIHVLLNTHSPYFLRAVQVYSAKYEIADVCKYYLAEKDREYSTITDVSDDVEKIYAKLAKPLQTLEDSRWEDD